MAAASHKSDNGSGLWSEAGGQGPAGELRGLGVPNSRTRSPGKPLVYFQHRPQL